MDVSAEAGLTFVHQFCDSRIANIIQSNGAGVAVLDYDNDGWMDLYFTNSGPLDGVTHHPPGTRREPNRLYRNLGNGKFEDVTAKAGVAGAGYGLGVAAGDYDGDGYTDLYLANVGPNILYRNKGDGTFEDVTAKARVGDKGCGIGAVFFDADGDGKLDLFVANYLTFDPDYKLYFNPDGYPGPLAYKGELNVLYRNKGDGTFEDVSERSGVQIKGHRAMSVAVADLDLDGDLDLYLCNDATPNIYLLNDGKGHFTDAALKAGVAFNALGEAAGSMTAAVGDCNGDRWPDILVSRLGYGSLYCGKNGQVFDDRMMVSGLGELTAQFVGWGCNFIDFDNDGDQDVFVAIGDAHHMVGWESLLLENDGNGNFTNAREKGGSFFDAKLRGRGSVTLDFNNDGRMDLLMTGIADRPFLLENRRAPGQWLTLHLEGTQSNREGSGAHIKVTAGGREFFAQARPQSAFLGQSDPRMHFGLGAADRVDAIEIRWPAGGVQTLRDVKAGQIVKIKEP
ncbi:MAG: CRTAC1 family protein [Verrucomicrobia bacterium]|nr:CRTAC1 family protein [Verrucomicrobiota bacterium]